MTETAQHPAHQAVLSQILHDDLGLSSEMQILGFGILVLTVNEILQNDVTDQLHATLRHTYILAVRFTISQNPS